MIRNTFLMIFVVCACGLATASHAHKISFVGELWCPDLTRDSIADFEDVGVLLSHQGTTCAEEGEDCRGDFNHNGYVGEGDLRVLLGNLGTCPLKGDVNRDGAVNLLDMAKVAADSDLDCHPDFDHDGRVGGNDLAIAEAVWEPSLDHHPRAHQVDGDDESLSVLDLQLVFEAQGRDCRSDVNKDGHVDQDDFNLVCTLAGQCPTP